MLRTMLVLNFIFLANLGVAGTALAEKTLLATIDGQELYEEDFSDESDPPSVALLASTSRFRHVAEKRLVELRLPACELEPDEPGISIFLLWWLDRLQSFRVTWIEENGKDARGSSDFLEKIDESLSHIIGADESARSVATAEIEQWLRYTCVQKEYKGKRFLVLDVANDLNKISKGQKVDTSTMLIVKGGLFMPYVLPLPEPVASFGMLFEAAVRDGQLSIPDPERNTYFFKRYKSEPIGNRSADEALQDLVIPYWQKAT